MVDRGLVRLVRGWFFEPSTPLVRAWQLGMVAAPIAALLLFGLLQCPVAALLHFPCPGCGLTRATLALTRGELVRTMSLNPSAVVVSPLLLGLTAHTAYGYVRHGRIAAFPRAASQLLLLSLGVLISVWLARWFGFFGGPLPV